MERKKPSSEELKPLPDLHTVSSYYIIRNSAEVLATYLWPGVTLSQQIDTQFHLGYKP